MNKKIGIIKRLIALLLIFLLSINSFAAVVSDNDGSAFITKAEFDSLKNNFQSQIDSYNTSIDSKIDGAIAQYLAGIKLSLTTSYDFPVGAGQSCLLFNSDQVILNPGTAGINFDIVVANVPKKNDYALTAAVLNMNRSPQPDYEIFSVNSSNAFQWYSSDCALTLISSKVQARCSSWGNYTNTGKWKLRWQGGIVGGKGSLTRGKRTIYVGTGASTEPEYCGEGSYSDEFGDVNFISGYGTNLNFSIGSKNWQGWGYADGIFRWTASNTLDVGSKVELVMDGYTGTNNQKIWLNTDPLSNTSICARPESRFDASKYKKFLTPASASVATKLMGYQSGKTGDSTGTTAIVNSVTWVTEGGIYTDSDVCSSPPQDAREWQEITFICDDKNSRNIKIKDSLIGPAFSKYNSYGWNGSITEGLPITELKPGDVVEFDLQHGNGTSVYFAVNTSPTALKTNYMNSIPNDSNIKWYVDGTLQTSGYKLLNGSTHKIKIENVSTSNQAVFYKMGQTSVSSVKLKVTLPTDFTVTSDG